MKTGYGKILRAKLVSRTERNETRVREDIESDIEMKNGTGRYIIMSTVCLTGKTEIRVQVPVREEVKSRYGKILREDMVSRTGRN